MGGYRDRRYPAIRNKYPVQPADAGIPIEENLLEITSDERLLEQERSSSEPELPRYLVATRESFGHKRTYAFLEATGRNWTIVTRDALDYRTVDDIDPDSRFGLAEPTLVWAKDGKAVQVYVDGMSAEDFCNYLGLEIDLVNTTTTSKRLSRILRPQAVTGFFDADAIQIDRMTDLTPEQEKVWDGAGIVSRATLLKMIDQLPEDMDPATRKKMIRELHRTRSVEFTIMTQDGQEKGHAIVSDELDVDFRVPWDIKKQVKLNREGCYLAFEFPHAHDDMRLDIQSYINMSEFFTPDQMIQYLHEEGDLFEEAVRTGNVAAAMARIDRDTTIEDMTWGLREFLASGGDIHWSGTHVGHFMNQHIRRLDNIHQKRLRLPMPGGRYYVMPAGVGQAAGLDISVARGEIYIDHDTGRAWVNDEDWVELPDAAELDPNHQKQVNDRWGIARILGGADNDDGLWVHPFTDYDGEQKVLVWRSPNDAGEYVILRPGEKGNSLPWKTVDGERSYPPNDSRRLTGRADQKFVSGEITDLGLINEHIQVDDTPASGRLIDAMSHAADREVVNGKLLGAVCNYLMVYKAAYGTVPKERPALLETIIDLKKTGADGTAVREWIDAEIQKMVNDPDVEVPEFLQHRIGGGRPGGPLIRSASDDHWMNRVLHAVDDHARHIEDIRDELKKQTRPPQQLFDYAFEEPDLVRAGGHVNQLYNGTIRKQTRNHPEKASPEDYDAARIAVDNYLNTFPECQQGRILIGAIANAYMSEIPGSDRAAWAAGPKDPTTGQQLPGNAQKTIAELRRIGLLDEIAQTENGLVVYPGASIVEPKIQTIAINGLWRNLFDIEAERTGQPKFEDYDDTIPAQKNIRKARAKQAKKQAQQMMERHERIELEVREEERDGEIRKILVSPKTGQKFGTIHRANASDYALGQHIMIRTGMVKKETVHAVVDVVQDDDTQSE